MKKAYTAHEIGYRRLRAKGLKCWNAIQTTGPRSEIDPDTVRFLQDVLAQPWAPKTGRVVELGCGSGPIVRWICRRRAFTGLGVDVSRTAITMAREQSNGMDICYVVRDLCGPPARTLGTCDLVVDGHCLHCITEAEDRSRFLSNARRLVGSGGVLVVMTMCGPVNREVASRVLKNQKIVGQTVYAFTERAGQYGGSRQIGGRSALPTRHFGHWRDILKEIERAGFRIQLYRFHHHTKDTFESFLCVGAIAT